MTLEINNRVAYNTASMNLFAYQDTHAILDFGNDYGSGDAAIYSEVRLTGSCDGGNGRGDGYGYGWPNRMVDSNGDGIGCAANDSRAHNFLDGDGGLSEHDNCCYNTMHNGDGLGTAN